MNKKFECFNECLNSYINLEEFPYGKTEIYVQPVIILDLEKIKNICIIQFTALGDIIETSAVINNFKNKKTDVKITFVLFDNYRKIFNNLKIIDNLKSINFNGIIETFKKNKNSAYEEIEKEINELNKQNFDLIINLHPSKISAYFISSISAKYKIGLQFNDEFSDTLLKGDLFLLTKLFKFYILKKSIFDENNVVDMFLKISQIKNYNRQLKLENSNEFENIYKNKKKKNEFIIGINFSAAWKNKKYPAENFNKLIKILNNDLKNKVTFILFGSKEDINESLIIEEDNKNVINLTGKIKLDELIDYVNVCDYIITNDTGTMHIAAAFNKKMIVILGPTSTKPIVNNSLCISLKNLECKFCFKSFCENNICLKNISPEIVSKIILRHINNNYDFSDINEILIETTDEYVNDIFFSAKYLNYKITDEKLCYAETINFLFEFVWNELNNKLYYENTYNSFDDMIINSSVSSLNSKLYNIEEILKRKFAEEVVRDTLNKIKIFFEKNKEYYNEHLDEAIRISEIIFTALRDNNELIIKNINFYLNKLILIDRILGKEEYLKKFFDLINIFFFKKEEKEEAEKIAANNLKLYQIKKIAFNILVRAIEN